MTAILSNRASGSRLGRLVTALIVTMVSVGCPDTTDRRIGFLDGWLEDHAPLIDAESRSAVVGVLLESEKKTGVDAFLLLAVIEEESAYDPSARSRRGARGLTQIVPETGRDVAFRIGVHWTGPESLNDPATNVRIGAAYLAEMKEEFGPWPEALAAYHSGPTRIRRIEKSGGKIPSGYASSVLARHRRIHEAYESSAP
jgi:soluble lytic murein transglycosylase-like protein